MILSTRLCRLIIVLSVFIVFAQAASFSFLEYDDPIHITKNSLVNGPSLPNLVTLWKKPFWKLYIPVTYTTWMGISAVSNGFYGRLHPGLFHFANVFIHLINTLLVYGILMLLQNGLTDEKMERNRLASLFGALLFAIHPVQVEAVVWIAGLKDVLSAFFFLLTTRLILSLNDKQACRQTFSTSVMSLFIATITFLLAILSKPSAVVLPVFIFVLIRYVQRQKQPHIFYFVLFFWLIIALADIVVTRTAQPEGGAVAIVNRLLVSFYVIVFYLKKLFFPHPLSIDYGRSLSFVLSRPLLWLYPLVPIGFAGVIVCIDRGKKIFACTALVLICIAPVLGLVPFDFQRISTVADRYLYLAVFAASIGMTIGVRKYFGRFLIVALILYIFFIGFISIQYTSKWRNTEILMRYTVAQNTKSVLATSDLGVALMKQGRIADAIVYLKKALNLDLSNTRARYDLAVSYACMGKFKAANRERDRIMQQDPKLGRFLSKVLAIIAKSFKKGKLPEFIKNKI